MTSLPIAAPRPDSLASLPARAWARVRAATRTQFYAQTGRTLWSMMLPVTEAQKRGRERSLREAYQTHVQLLDRPGMHEVVTGAEREDWLTLPAFLALAPLDILRVLRKRTRAIGKISVTPPDEFPYPSYYLNDFHNQVNGNLSWRSALTYEWQIRFLFLGTNRLMRQAIIDHIPEGNHLDILDVACGTATWVKMARLQKRMHHITGIDLSPQYLGVAKLLHGSNANYMQMNAEHLDPTWTGKFDVVTCIWLFHELPREAQVNVLLEMARVLKPGGKLLFLDAVQAEDIPDRDLTGGNRDFFDFFNEPHFLDYQSLDLAKLFTDHGFTVLQRERWYASKLLVAQKT